MRLELAKLHQDLKTTMIYVTHDQVEAMTLADRIVVLDKGIVQQVGSPLDLYNRPANRFVAGFIGSPAMNFVAVQGQGGTVTLPGGGQLALARPGTIAELGIRPEHVALTNAGAGQLPGTVSVVEQLGNTSYVYLDTPAGQMIAEAAPGVAAHPGDKVGLTLDPAHLHAFDSTGRALAA